MPRCGYGFVGFIGGSVVDVVILAIERHAVVRPQRAHEIDLLFHGPPAVGEVLVQDRVLELVPADREVYLLTAAAEHMDAFSLFRDEHSLALREHHDAAHETDLRRHGCQVAEQY
jgi:hypothetical protein